MTEMKEFYLITSNVSEVEKEIALIEKCGPEWVLLAGAEGPYLVDGRLNLDLPIEYTLLAFSESDPIIKKYLARIGNVNFRWIKTGEKESLRRSKNRCKADLPEWQEKKHKAVVLLERGVSVKVAAQQSGVSTPVVSRLKRQFIDDSRPES
ncbi:hypothetical protein KFE80_03540 [bacterium SCSIO 12696]|nr:hypothetical protein KFE80_03540 [bacterium SCSIO 12696]